MAKDIIPHINFESSVDAIAYYERVFGAENANRMPLNKEMAENFGYSKDDTDLESHTVHGSMHIFDQPIYFADIFNNIAQLPTGLTFLLGTTMDDAAAITELESLWGKVVSSGEVEVTMPFAEQFWGGKFGQLTDKFGITWQFGVNEQL